MSNNDFNEDPTSLKANESLSSNKNIYNEKLPSRQTFTVCINALFPSVIASTF